MVKERLWVANDNGEYPVTISIEPGGQLLLPGMKAYATIILKEKTDVLTPVSYTHLTSNKSNLYRTLHMN